MVKCSLKKKTLHLGIEQPLKQTQQLQLTEVQCCKFEVKHLFILYCKPQKWVMVPVLVGPIITTERPNELESMGEAKFIPFLSQAEKV